MSTAGKVLTVCVALLLLGWLVLLSMVAQRNRNWGQEVKKYADQIPGLKEELARTLEGVAQDKDRLAQHQVMHEEQIAISRLRVADAELLLNDTIETLERVKNQSTSQQEAAKTAEAIKDRWNEQKARTEKDLAAARDEVEKLTDQNGKLQDRLAQLKDEFQKTLAENQRLVRRISQGGRRARTRSQ